MDGGLHPELHFSNNKLKQHTGNRKHVNDVTQHLPVFTIYQRHSCKLFVQSPESGKVPNFAEIFQTPSCVTGKCISNSQGKNKKENNADTQTDTDRKK